jgi:hypothetical protein
MLKGGPGKILLCPSKIFLPPNIYKKSQKNKIKKLSKSTPPAPTRYTKKKKGKGKEKKKRTKTFKVSTTCINTED